MSQPAADPTPKPLFYTNPVLLDREKHRAAGSGSRKSFGFSRNSQFIPALHEEFTAAASELPIVFLPSGGTISPVFLMSLDAGRNGFVGDDGRWTGGYVPAYLRRYPFILGETGGEEAVICVEEGADALGAEQGEPLFAEDGSSTTALDEVIGFTNEYFRASKRTEAFVKRLMDLDLFHNITIENKKPGGDNRTIHGLLSINEERLQSLADEAFLALRHDRLLTPCFAQLFSLKQMERLDR
ncbi:SapC family protein [Aurantimonas sp. MSK8Z-1]|uniref:SapC family protein n=1 Tax=Mangrovibrevibacter kandeliae TaxID=2968473 RepID=UPI0021176B3E|nr:SapC family protein [Aurantimonas sp. MSK8Z-1]MCW4113341.1 SapC family protein [Aurantimonas sp. MSK8Z-1]